MAKKQKFVQQLKYVQIDHYSFRLLASLSLTLRWQTFALTRFALFDGIKLNGIFNYNCYYRSNIRNYQRFEHLRFFLISFTDVPILVFLKSTENIFFILLVRLVKNNKNRNASQKTWFFKPFKNYKTNAYKDVVPPP